jgi:hypothetical protein
MGALIVFNVSIHQFRKPAGYPSGANALLRGRAQKAGCRHPRTLLSINIVEMDKA